MSQRFRIGAWVVEPWRNRILNNGHVTYLEPKVMQVLLSLVQHAQHPVSRDYLFETVWIDTVVEETTLRRTISQLRKAFGDDPRHPRFIETIPKVGYRLIAPVSPFALNKTIPSPTLNRATGATIKLGAFRHRAKGLIGALLVLLLVSAAAWIGFFSATAPPSSYPTQPFTSYVGQEVEPALSPDGRMVVFVRHDEPVSTHDIYVKYVGTETLVRLTKDPAFDLNPTWSPDGRSIAFTRRTRNTCEIFIVPLQQTEGRKLTDCYPPATAPDWSPGLSWSPDGKSLVFPDKPTTEDRYGLFLIALDSQEKQSLTASPPREWDSKPIFSPDGKTVAFLRSSVDRGQDLYLVPVAGGMPRRLTTDAGRIAGYDWTADGQRIVFTSNRDGRFKLWQIDVDGGEPEWLAHLGAYDPSSVSLARKGSGLVYTEWRYVVNIWHIPLAPGATGSATPEPLITSTQWDLYPHISPDTSHHQIVFVSNRSGSQEVWRTKADGTHPTRLTDWGNAVTTMPRWSPNGRSIAFTAHVNLHADLYIVDAQGGPPKALTADPYMNVAPSWSRDGRWIYFSSDRDGTWNVWKLPATGGTPIQVTWHGGYLAQESPDASSLYYTKIGYPGLWRMPMEGGLETLTLPSLTLNDRINWAITRQGVYFVARENGAASLAFYAFADEQITLLSDPLPALQEFDLGLTVSPDQAGLLFAQVDQAESDIMLIESFE